MVTMILVKNGVFSRYDFSYRLLPFVGISPPIYLSFQFTNNYSHIENAFQIFELLPVQCLKIYLYLEIQPLLLICLKKRVDG